MSVKSAEVRQSALLRRRQSRSQFFGGFKGRHEVPEPTLHVHHQRASSPEVRFGVKRWSSAIMGNDSTVAVMSRTARYACPPGRDRWSADDGAWTRPFTTFRSGRRRPRSGSQGCIQLVQGTARLAETTHGDRVARNRHRRRPRGPASRHHAAGWSLSSTIRPD